MNLDELKILGRYPFLPETKDYVNSLNLTLSDMQNHPIYSNSLEEGRKRVIDAVNNSLHQEIDDKILAEFSILSYAIARILINLIHNKSLLQRYARGEAEQAYKFLKDEDYTVIKRITLEVNFPLEDDKIHFSTYLKLSKDLSRKNPQQWKLIQRELNKGEVKINQSEKLILLREAIKHKIAEPLPSIKGIPSQFFKLAQNLKSTLLGTERKIEVKEINKRALPPCIISMLRSMEGGDISHQGMFILATFFINLNLPKEKIIRIFSKFPQFSEEKTSYQVEFLSGEKSETKYTCPGCEKIKFYGLCPKDCGVKHPISYYYKNRWRR